jgi:hypothetical protein
MENTFIAYGTSSVSESRFTPFVSTTSTTTIGCSSAASWNSSNEQ